jgi:hypothetical protein
MCSIGMTFVLNSEKSLTQIVKSVFRLNDSRFVFSFILEIWKTELQINKSVFRWNDFRFLSNVKS